MSSRSKITVAERKAVEGDSPQQPNGDNMRINHSLDLCREGQKNAFSQLSNQLRDEADAIGTLSCTTVVYTEKSWTIDVSHLGTTPTNFCCIILPMRMSHLLHHRFAVCDLFDQAQTRRSLTIL